MDHHHVGRHLHRLGAGSIAPPAVGTRLLLLHLLELPELDMYIDIRFIILLTRFDAKEIASSNNISTLLPCFLIRF